MIKKIRNRLKNSILIILDISAFYCSLLIAFYMRKSLYVFSPEIVPLEFPLEHFLRIWWLPAVFLSFIANERLYIRKLPFWDETRALLKASTASTIAILSIITLSKMSSDISRLTVIFLWFCGTLLFPAFRMVGKKILFAAGLWRDNVIIIGAGTAGRAIAQGINGNNHMGYHVLGFLDDDDRIGSQVNLDGRLYTIFGKIGDFRKFIELLDVSTVIIALPSLSVTELAEITTSIQKHTRNILLMPDIKGVPLTNTELYYLFMQQLFLLKINNNLKSPFNKFIKRLFELTLSLLFLPPLLVIIGIIGLLIMLDSPGPAFYRQPRVGRNGKPFIVYKFRSMYLDSTARLGNILTTDPSAKKEWEAHFKLKNDPRVTRMGMFLRRTSLDELPQIFNVMFGDMSLVGPRPVLNEEITRYYRELADYYFLVRPGITGLWQVSGRNDLDYSMRVKLDAWYVLNWSVWLDIVILFKTIRVVWSKEGAY